jgi:hypothetical protein
MFPSPFGLVLLSSLVVGPPHPNMSKNPDIKRAYGSCSFKGGQMHGLDQFCYYDCDGQTFEVTMHFPNNQCPISIDP